MQIAQIIPKTRTQKEAVFDYAIPPEILPQIKIGVLVEVPFHGRKLQGVIIDIKKSSKLQNLKSIIKIIDTTPVIDENHIKLTKWIANYYLASLGQALFSNIVPPAYHAIKEEKSQIDFKTISSKKLSKNILIIAEFSIRLKYYQEEIKKTLANQKSVIILVPDLELIPYFSFSLKNATIFHGKLSKTERWQVFNKIRKGQTSIIIGSQSALFAPLPNLGLIIIDQEESETYKNDRSPRYQAVKTAFKLGEIIKARVILGSLTPSLDSFFETHNGKLILKRSRLKFFPKITIIKKISQKEIIDPLLENRIAKNFMENKKTLLFLDRKGEGVKFLCQDCGWIFLCPNCDTPLTPTATKARCFNCEKDYQLPLKCPKCQSFKLKAYGWGTSQIEKNIKKLFPKAKIIRLENEVTINPKTVPWDIAIATSYALKFTFPPIALVGIIDADQNLSFPDFRASERAFRKIYKFLKIGEEGIIQTHLPESRFIAALAKLDYEKFYNTEISNRRKYLFPPITKLIRLLYRNKNEDVVITETQDKYKKIKNISLKNKSIMLSEPSPAFISRKNKFYRHQIIIRLTGPRSKELEMFLMTLAKEWVIDVDPINLL